MQLPKRKRVRLKGFDYSTPEAYFVTICLKEQGLKKNNYSKILSTTTLSAVKRLREKYGNTLTQI